MLMILPFLANAFGMLIFGALLEQFASITWIIIFVNAFFIAAIAIFSRKYFKRY